MIKSIKRLLPILALLVTATFFTACDKYSEGPSISLRERDERVSNIWKVQELKQNGVDVALDENTSNMRYEFTMERVYNLYDSRTPDNVQKGSWIFKDNNETLELNNNTDAFADAEVINNGNYTILRLADDELWLSRDSEVHGKEEIKLQAE